MARIIIWRQVAIAFHLHSYCRRMFRHHSKVYSATYATLPRRKRWNDHGSVTTSPARCSRSSAFLTSTWNWWSLGLISHLTYLLVEIHLSVIMQRDIWFLLQTKLIFATLYNKHCKQISSLKRTTINICSFFYHRFWISKWFDMHDCLPVMQ